MEMDIRKQRIFTFGVEEPSDTVNRAIFFRDLAKVFSNAHLLSLEYPYGDSPNNNS